MKFFARHTWHLGLLLLCATAFGGSAESFDWPRWQGPDGNAVSKETGLLKEWPKDGPTLAWKIKGLGGGYSAPSIAAGQIYCMGNRGNDEVVWALSEADGKTLWVTRLGDAYRVGRPQGIEGPGCTPTVDGDRVYVLGLAGNLVCLQASDGKIIWQKSLTRDLGGVIPTWRYNESPLIDGDKVICTPGGRDATMVALNKLTGETIWKSLVPGAPPAAYASVIAYDFEGQRQYAQFTDKGLVGIAAADGKFLWRYNRPANTYGINVSTPLYHDGMVFASAAYGTGGGAVKLSKDASGDVKADEVYFSNRLQSHHGGVVLVDGYPYGANGGLEGGNLVCLEFKTGKVMWDGREIARRETAKGSILLADGRLYYRQETGPMVLIEPSSKEYVERGRFDPPDRSNQSAWPHPVVANGKLYLRDQDVLQCYDVKGK